MSDTPEQPDPEPAPEGDAPPEGDPEAGQQATTMLTKDYLGRALTNATPGTSQATDHLGRQIAAGNLDFLGRRLVA